VLDLLLSLSLSTQVNTLLDPLFQLLSKVTSGKERSIWVGLASSK
jgi:hypothetical protein